RSLSVSYASWYLVSGLLVFACATACTLLSMYANAFRIGFVPSILAPRAISCNILWDFGPAQQVNGSRQAKPGAMRGASGTIESRTLAEEEILYDRTLRIRREGRWRRRAPIRGGNTPPPPHLPARFPARRGDGPRLPGARRPAG